MLASSEVRLAAKKTGDFCIILVFTMEEGYSVTQTKERT